MKFANWFNEQINKSGLTLREIGRRAGISHASLSKYANAEIVPSSESCQKLAAALGILPEEVLYQAGHLPSKPDIADLGITETQLRALNAVRKAEGKEPLSKTWLAAYLEGESAECPTDGLIARVQVRRPDMDLSLLEKAKGKMREEFFRALLQSVMITVPGSREEDEAFTTLRRRLRWNLGLKPISKEEKIDFIMSYLEQLDDDALEEEVMRIISEEEKEEKASVRAPRRVTASS